MAGVIPYWYIIWQELFRNLYWYIIWQELFREHEETEQKVRSDYDARRKQEEIEDRMFHHLRQAEQEKEQETHKVEDSLI